MFRITHTVTTNPAQTTADLAVTPEALTTVQRARDFTLTYLRVLDSEPYHPAAPGASLEKAALAAVQEVFVDTYGFAIDGINDFNLDAVRKTMLVGGHNRFLIEGPDQGCNQLAVALLILDKMAGDIEQEEEPFNALLDEVKYDNTGNRAREVIRARIGCRCLARPAPGA